MSLPESILVGDNGHLTHHNQVHDWFNQPRGLSEIRYAHPNGNNANDGLTWGTAKKDVVSAYDALPSTGGTIYIANLTYWDSVNTDRGLWLVGGGDPNAGSPLTGWRVRKRCSFIGVGGDHTSQSHVGVQAFVFGGSGTDRNKPSIWIAGTGGPLYFENIHTQYHAVAWRLGVKSDLSGNVDSSGMMFRGCSFGLNAIAGNGPGLELGYMYWLFMEHCVFLANSAAYTLTAATRSGAVATFTTSITHFLEVGDTVNVTGVTPSGYNGHWTVTAETDTTFTVTLAGDPGGSGSAFGTAEPVKNYRRAAIGHWSNFFATSQTPSGLLHFENCNFAGGGFYYKPNGATSWGSVIMRNITHEGDFVGPEPSTFLLRENIYGQGLAAAGGHIFIQNIERADTDNTGFGVEVEALRGTAPNVVTVINATSSGPVTQLGQTTSRAQTGFGSGESFSFHSGHKRAFSPVAVRYTNLASHTLSGGTWTTGLVAPDGTTNASSLTGSGGTATEGFYFTGFGHAVGDWFIAGVWHKYITLSASNDNDWPFIGFGGAARLDNGPTGGANIDSPNRWEDGAWNWVCEYHQITTAGDQTGFSARAANGNTVAYFAPIFLRIPTAENLDEDEVREITRHLGTYPPSAAVGQISMLAGQSLNMPSGYIQGFEIADPAAPAANGSRMFTRDNGAGKTQLCVRFNTGAVQVIASEP